MHKNRREALAQAAQLHRMNLRKNLERRMESAKARGDEHLLRLLQAEADYLG